jgi:hypothetical protein
MESQKTHGKRGSIQKSPDWPPGAGTANGAALCHSVQLDASGSGQGPVAGSCEHGNESWSSIKGGEFLD